MSDRSSALSMTIPARIANAARSMWETPRSQRETVSGEVSSNSTPVEVHGPARIADQRRNRGLEDVSCNGTNRWTHFRVQTATAASGALALHALHSSPRYTVMTSSCSSMISRCTSPSGSRLTTCQRPFAAICTIPCGRVHAADRRKGHRAPPSRSKHEHQRRFGHCARGSGFWASLPIPHPH